MQIERSVPFWLEARLFPVYVILTFVFLFIPGLSLIGFSFASLATVHYVVGRTEKQLMTTIALEWKHYEPLMFNHESTTLRLQLFGLEALQKLGLKTTLRLHTDEGWSFRTWIRFIPIHTMPPSGRMSNWIFQSGRHAGDRPHLTKSS